MNTIDRDIDIEMLILVLQHCSKEIYDATSSCNGYTIARNEHFDEDISKRISIMKRATELINLLYDNNCSITELNVKEVNDG